MRVEILPVTGLGEVRSGDQLSALLSSCLANQALAGDILVVTHKIVSKAEGCLVDLDSVQPSAQAVEWSQKWKKDPRQTEVVLQQTKQVVRMERGVIVSQTHHGLVCANAGVDRSNIPGDSVCTLPVDPDASALQLHEVLSERLGFHLPVLISDSFGRAWRMGIVNVAIGLAGMHPFNDCRGQVDPHGHLLEASVIATADILCASADLVMGKCEGVPAALIRGVEYQPIAGCARDLIRPWKDDFFH